jgi:dethiobiotin synthetase
VTSGLFVTGTDTGVGKTILSAALLAAIAAAGRRVHAYKPAVTGLDEPPEQPWPRDHELLASVSAMDPEQVAPRRYGPAVSPHLAAELASERPGEHRKRETILAETQRVLERADFEQATLIVEGVGGLLVPLAENLDVRELAAALGLPVLIAARPGLGTINHTLLSVEAARAAGLEVRAVVLTPWAQTPTTIECSNRETIARLGEVETAALERISGPSPAELARAGATLPWQRWLG